MDLIKDKFYGLTICCALGDAMGSAADILHQEGSEDIINSPEMAEGYWNEGCTLMLCEMDHLVQQVPFSFVLSQAIDTGYLTSTGDVTNLCKRTINADIQEPCKHNTDCLPLVGGVAMYYVRNYEQGHVHAFNNPLASGCRLCMDACKFYHAVLDLALHGASKKDILSIGSYANLSLVPEISNLLNIHTEMYDLTGADDVVSCLQMVLHVFRHTDNIEDSLTTVVNHSEAPVRTGAIMGQLCGAYYGLINVKEEWLDCLQGKRILTKLTKKILPKIERLNVGKHDRKVLKRASPGAGSLGDEDHGIA
jgi:ADP-ribosyl-[dinitrogen reductase] hydrolase